MIKKIKALAAGIAVSVAVLLPALSLAPVSAQDSSIQNSLCSGTALSTVENGETCGSTTAGSTTGVSDAVSQAVDILSWIVGIASVIMIIVGGFKYITSGGASDKVSGAKNTIIYAIIGLVIVALAQFIVNFVIGAALEVDGQ